MKLKEIKVYIYIYIYTHTHTHIPQIARKKNGDKNKITKLIVLICNYLELRL
jgi:hypothetical protein